VNSFRRVVRRGVHQLFDLGDGRERGAVASTTIVRAERAAENHWSSWLGEGEQGGAGMSQDFQPFRQVWPVSLLPAWPGLVVVGGGGTQGDCNAGVVRVCRGEEPNAENICGLAKAMSMALGL